MFGINGGCAQTVKEANDVGEVHVVVDDDLAVELDQCERYEEDQVRRAHVLCRPDHLPDREHVLVDHLCRHDSHIDRISV